MRKFRKEVILDFDYTLFDAAKFKLALAAALRIHGVRRGVFFETYKRAVHRRSGGYNYSLERHVSLLHGLISTLSITTALRDLNRVVTNSHRYLYPDTKHFLRQLKRHGFRTILVTHGNPRFQQRKLEGSSISSLFDKIVLSNQIKVVTLRRLAHKFDEVFFVSDHPKELAPVRRQLPQLLPVMKLGGYGDRATAKQLGIPAFRSLKAIEKYIIKYYQQHNKGV